MWRCDVTQSILSSPHCANTTTHLSPISIRQHHHCPLSTTIYTNVFGTGTGSSDEGQRGTGRDDAGGSRGGGVNRRRLKTRRVLSQVCFFFSYILFYYANEFASLRPPPRRVTTRKRRPSSPLAQKRPKRRFLPSFGLLYVRYGCYIMTSTTLPP